MRKIFVGFLLIFYITQVAAVSKSSYFELNLAKSGKDTLISNLNYLKSILGDDGWYFVSDETRKPIKQLVDYVYNDPIDSVVTDVFHLLNDSALVFVNRDPLSIKNKGKVPGYVSESEITARLARLNDSIWENTDIHLINVPYKILGSYQDSVELIDTEYMRKKIENGFHSFPDSIKYPDSILLVDAQYLHRIDSIRSEYIEKIRNAYNDSILMVYKDSIELSYRTQYLNNLSDSLQKERERRIHNENLSVLTNYNNNQIEVVNDSIEQIVNKLYAIVFDEPYEFYMENILGEETRVLSRNRERYFHWFWLKTAQNDSLAIRVENVGKKRVRLITDDAVLFERYDKRSTIEAGELEIEKLDAGLQKVHIVEPKATPWRLFGKAYWGLTQTYINPYWSKGGNSSASTITTFSYDANYSKDKIKWENGIDAKLGYIYYLLDEEERDEVERMWHKNSDNLQITSRLGISAFKKWFYSAEANLKTQFGYGYNNQKDATKRSGFFAPAYINLSVGMDYKPNKNFSAFISPLSLKTMIVADTLVDRSRYKLDEGKNSKSTAGISGKLNYSTNVMKNVTLRTKNSLFIHLNKENFIKIPDFDSETIIDFKVNEFITTQLNVHFVYDKDVISKDSEGIALDKTKLQLKEFITLGVAYNF